MTQSARVIHEKKVAIILVMDASDNLIRSFYKPRPETFLLQFNFFIVALKVIVKSNKKNARRLMLASIIYLPVLLIIILIERTLY